MYTVTCLFGNVNACGMLFFLLCTKGERHCRYVSGRRGEKPINVSTKRGFSHVRHGVPLEHTHTEVRRGLEVRVSQFIIPSALDVYNLENLIVSTGDVIVRKLP